MRPPRFLHVGIAYNPPNPTFMAAVDQAIDSEALDWFRYADQCYLVWTSSDAETICRKLLRVPGMQGVRIFTCAIDVNDGFGYLSPAVWEWLRRDRGAGPLHTWHPLDAANPSSPWAPLPPLQRPSPVWPLLLPPPPPKK